MIQFRLLFVCLLCGTAFARSKNKKSSRAVPEDVKPCQINGFPWYWDDISQKCCPCVACPRPVVWGGFQGHNSECSAFYSTIPSNGIVLRCPTSQSSDCYSLEEVQSGKLDLLYFYADTKKTWPKSGRKQGRKQGNKRKGKPAKSTSVTISSVPLFNSSTTTLRPPITSRAPPELPPKVTPNENPPISTTFIAVIAVLSVLLLAALIVCMLFCRSRDKSYQGNWWCFKKQELPQRESMDGTSHPSLNNRSPLGRNAPSREDSVQEEPVILEDPQPPRVNVHPDGASISPHRNQRRGNPVVNVNRNEGVIYVCGDIYHPDRSFLSPMRGPHRDDFPSGVPISPESFRFSNDSGSTFVKQPVPASVTVRATNDDDEVHSRPVHMSKNDHPSTAYYYDAYGFNRDRSCKGYLPRHTSTSYSAGSQFEFNNSEETVAKEPVSTSVDEVENEPLLGRLSDSVNSSPSQLYTTAVQESGGDCTSDTNNQVLNDELSVSSIDSSADGD